MSESTNTIKPSLSFGILFGLIMIFEFVLLYVIDIDPIENPTIGILTNVLNYFVFPLTFIYLGANIQKQKFNNGFLSFVECLKIGVSICFIAGVLYALFSVVFNTIFPEFVDELLQKTRMVILQKNPELASEQVEMAVSMTKKFMNPTIMVPVTIVMYSFIGLICSLIIGLIVRKDNPQL